MNKIKKILNKYSLKPKKIEMRGKVTFIEADDKKYVVKKQNTKEIYKYLNSRSFNYYPKIITDSNDDYEIMEYIEDVNTPIEQKMLDLIDVVALLHYKTTHYKEIDEADYKEIYEDLLNNVEYLFSYYSDIITVIESKVFMSPSEYLFARNVSIIFKTLYKNKQDIEEWYKLIKTKTKQRLVVLHNNLSLDHLIRNESTFLISWNKAKIGIPIFDLYKLYNNHALDFDFEEILSRYERTYPLKKEEKELLFILISMPKKIDFDKDEYTMCKIVSKEIDRIYKTSNMLPPKYTENTPQEA